MLLTLLRPGALYCLCLNCRFKPWNSHMVTLLFCFPINTSSQKKRNIMQSSWNQMMVLSSVGLRFFEPEAIIKCHFVEDAIIIIVPQNMKRPCSSPRQTVGVSPSETSVFPGSLTFTADIFNMWVLRQLDWGNTGTVSIILFARLRRRFTCSL